MIYRLFLSSSLFCSNFSYKFLKNSHVHIVIFWKKKQEQKTLLVSLFQCHQWKIRILHSQKPFARVALLLCSKLSILIIKISSALSTLNSRSTFFLLLKFLLFFFFSFKSTLSHEIPNPKSPISPPPQNPSFYYSLLFIRSPLPLHLSSTPLCTAPTQLIFF